MQELNLVYKYPPIFWNTACLITDAGGADLDFDDEEEESVEEETAESSDEPEDGTKQKSINYGKIAKAIGRCKHNGIEVMTPNINKSAIAFYPDASANVIRYGLGGIARVGFDLAQQIIINRPYTSLKDFYSKVNVSVLQLVNLVKSGAFDDFGTREEIMSQAIQLVASTRKSLTMSSLNVLITNNLLPASLQFEVKCVNYNNYLKRLASGDLYLLDSIAYDFYANNFDIDSLIVDGDAKSGFSLSKKVWEKQLKPLQENIKTYINNNKDMLLSKLNEASFNETYAKYAAGNRASWEMDAVSFYSKEHEMDYVNTDWYGITPSGQIDSEPRIDSFYKRDGELKPIYHIYRIAGTVLEKNKMKHTITLLTSDGVVTVKLYGDAFTNFDRQISERGADGKKKVIESSFFARGSKLLICGIMRGENQFLAKKYKNTPYPLLEYVTEINSDGSITTKSKRCDE